MSNFSFKQWLKKSIVSLVINKEISAEYAALRCVEQLDRGRFSELDCEEIYLEITMDDAQKRAAEQIFAKS